MKITLIQTCDQTKYKPLFDVTSRASRRFCELQDIDFRPFVGLKRGNAPWHAIFNRIPLLAELLAEDFDGWAIYLDADAYPFDLQFDLRRYLSDSAYYGMMGPNAGGERWQANSGVMLLNCADRRTREVVADWNRLFDALMPEDRLQGLPEWPQGVPDDQSMLHAIMQQRPDNTEILKLEPISFIGAPSASFIRQVLRIHGDMLQRCQIAEQGVAEALRRSGSSVA